MKTIIQTVFATFIWAWIALDTLIVWFLILLLTPFDRNQRVAYHIANFWGKSILGFNPFWKVDIEGLSHIRKNVAYVLVANHNSMADIICLYCLGRHFKWIAKENLFKIPFFGWTMSLLNYIPLSRGEHSSIQSSYELAQQWLKKNISVLFFPEGTRSRTSQMGPFKNGAFKLALRTRKPIIPIVLEGTADMLERGHSIMSAHVHIKIKVLPVININNYSEGDFERLKNDVRHAMAQALQQMRSNN